jgi:hypothetical protein
MAHERDYDEARAAEPIRIKTSGEWYEYTPEAPIDVAVEWMDRQTKLSTELGESGGEYMHHNYGLILGERNYAEMRENAVGAKTIDTIYRDLLDWWGLWVRPADKVSELEEQLEALEGVASRSTINQADRLVFAGAVATLRVAVAEWQALNEEEEVDEEADAETPA